MKIAVLCGSPKGEYSITLQHVRYLARKLPEHEFQPFYVAHDIKKLEKNREAFEQVIQAVREADGVLWAFGLWVLVVAAQYMRFMELITERGAASAFDGKYTAALSTSIHYYDHTAHNFVQAVCDDLGMNFVDSLSQDLRDLDKLEARQQLLLFGKNFISAIENRAATTRRFQPLEFSDFAYCPGPAKPSVETLGKKVLVLTDKYDPETNLGRMIDRFRSAFTQEAELIDLRDIDIKGACLGCMRCGYDYTCAYKDGFKEFYNKRVRAADCIVFAGEMRGRYLSSLWKTFFDRAFFWNHTPSLTGKQLAYLVSGPISQNANLLQILEASSTARQEANHVDVLSDECEDSAELDRALQGLARKLVQFSVEGYQRPQNFLAVGGHKIFRDNIWGRLRIIWQADHRHYKKTGYYDFPQRKYALRLLMGLGMLVTKIPFVRKKLYDNLLTGPRRRMSKIAETAD